MSSMPETAMVFAAGLGKRMRPVTDRCPSRWSRSPAGPCSTIRWTASPLPASSGPSSTCIIWPTRSRAHLAGRRNPAVMLSDERGRVARPGRRHPPCAGRARSRALLDLQHRRIWVEGPRSNLRRLAALWDPARMDVALLVAAAATSVGVDWPGDFPMDAEGRLLKREEHGVAPFVYAGIGIIKPELFAPMSETPFRLAPFFFDAAETRPAVRLPARRNLAPRRHARGYRRSGGGDRTVGAVTAGGGRPARGAGLFDPPGRSLPRDPERGPARRRSGRGLFARRRPPRLGRGDHLCADAAVGARLGGGPSPSGSGRPRLCCPASCRSAPWTTPSCCSRKAGLEEALSPDLPVAIGDIARRMVLTRLILAWGEAVRHAIVSVDGAGRRSLHGEEPLNVATSPADAWHLSGELAALMDELTIEDVAWTRMAPLGTDAFDRYWRITLDFLDIAIAQYPLILAERGEVDRATRQALPDRGRGGAACRRARAPARWWWRAPPAPTRRPPG